MINDKLVLADGTKIALESSQGIGALHVVTECKAAACNIWEKFTKENLKHVVVKNADGETTGNYTDMVLDCIVGTENVDNTVRVIFKLRNKTAEEVLAERVAALETDQQMQDGAISDLGQAVSDVVGGGAR